MTATIGISKAAQALGIKRSKLQKLIKSGELSTFEGQILLDELQKCFPILAISPSNFASELEFIKKAAYSNRVQKAVLPSKEELSHQLHRTQMSLLVEKQKATKYLDIIEGLLHQLSLVRQQSDSESKETIDQISAWVVKNMNAKR